MQSVKKALGPLSPLLTSITFTFAIFCVRAASLRYRISLLNASGGGGGGLAVRVADKWLKTSRG